MLLVPGDKHRLRRSVARHRRHPQTPKASPAGSSRCCGTTTSATSSPTAAKSPTTRSAATTSRSAGRRCEPPLPEGLRRQVQRNAWCGPGLLERADRRLRPRRGEAVRGHRDLVSRLLAGARLRAAVAAAAGRPSCGWSSRSRSASSCPATRSPRRPSTAGRSAGATGALSLGLSLAVLPLAALAAQLPRRAPRRTWALLLVLVVLAGSGLAALRRPRAGRTARPPRLPRPTRRSCSSTAPASGGAAVAVGLAFHVLPAKNAIGSHGDVDARPAAKTPARRSGSACAATSSARPTTSCGCGWAAARSP